MEGNFCHTGMDLVNITMKELVNYMQKEKQAADIQDSRCALYQELSTGDAQDNWAETILQEKVIQPMTTKIKKKRPMKITISIHGKNISSILAIETTSSSAKRKVCSIHATIMLLLTLKVIIKSIISLL